MQLDGEREEWAARLFRSIDDMDTETFLSFLADDVLFRFGNADPVIGKAAVGAAVSGFFRSLRGVDHKLTRAWDEGDTVICHGTVTYTRQEGTTLKVPFADILSMDGTLIREYLIFMDVSELFPSA